MFQKLEAVEKRYDELTKLISDPEVISRTNEWQKYMKEHAEISDIVEKYKEYKKVNQEMEDAKEMVANGCKFLCEGSNMPTTNDALKYLMDNGVVVAPSKAANAGGVACSCIEMGQNAGHTVYSPEQVYAQLETIMVNIHKHAAEASEKYGLGYNLVAGANIAGFEKVAEAMMAQGLV